MAPLETVPQLVLVPFQVVVVLAPISTLLAMPPVKVARLVKVLTPVALFVPRFTVTALV